jgi:hypothetical protein
MRFDPFRELDRLAEQTVSVRARTRRAGSRLTRE